MSVKELIEKLQGFDPDATVRFDDTDTPIQGIAGFSNHPYSVPVVYIW